MGSLERIANRERAQALDHNSQCSSTRSKNGVTAVEKSKKAQIVELLTEIRDELKAMRISESLKGAPKLWGKTEIAAYLGLAERTIEEVVVRPKFPAPVSTTGSSRGHRWFMEDVVEWARINVSNIPQSRTRRPRSVTPQAHP